MGDARTGGLAHLVASVWLPHQAGSVAGETLLVQARAGGVQAGTRLLTPAEAGELSRAIRSALSAPRSATIRPAGQDPVMVCRISDDACRVDGLIYAADEARKLAVALDMAAARVRAYDARRDTPQPHPSFLDSACTEVVTSSVSLRARLGGRHG